MVMPEVRFEKTKDLLGRSLSEKPPESALRYP